MTGDEDKALTMLLRRVVVLCYWSVNIKMNVFLPTSRDGIRSYGCEVWGIHTQHVIAYGARSLQQMTVAENSGDEHTNIFITSEHLKKKAKQTRQNKQKTQAFKNSSDTFKLHTKQPVKGQSGLPLKAGDCLILVNLPLKWT